MDIIIKNKNVGTDKLEGEFHAPLSYGKGSNKNVWLCCISQDCQEPTYLSSKTQGFICKKCGKYNGNRKECEDLFKEKLEKGELFNENSPHIKTDQAKELVNIKDTMEIRADLYRRGITRKNVGSDRYHKILTNKLREQHVGKCRLNLSQ